MFQNFSAFFLITIKTDKNQKGVMIISPFAKFMQTRNLDKADFPYSENGPKMRHHLNLLFGTWLALIIIVIGIFTFAKVQGWQSTPPANQAYLEKQLQKQSGSANSANGDGFDAVLKMLGLDGVIGQNADQRTVDQKKQDSNQTNALNNPNKNQSPTDNTAGQQGVTSVSVKPELKQQLAQLKSYQHYQAAASVAKGIGHLANVVFVLVIVEGLLYGYNIIRRQRCYERNVFANDGKALRLRRQLLHAMSINGRAKEARSKVFSFKDNSTASVSDRNAYQALRVIQKPVVYVNTRQKQDNEKIVNTMYRIIYKLPQVQEVRDKVTSETEHVSELGTSLLKGKAQFGAGFTSDDLQYQTFTAEAEEKDPYDYSDILSGQTVDNTVYETMFPLSLFDDRQKVIDEKKYQAQQWAQRNVPTLRSFLTTAKVKGTTLLRKEVGGSSVLYVFKLSEDTSVPRVDQLGDDLDNFMKVTGSDAQIAEGNLSLTVPLPSDYKTPLNTATLYREAFGDGDVYQPPKVDDEEGDSNDSDD